jgi:hypothetical protein
MVKILISPSVPLVKSRVRHCGCIKHCMEALVNWSRITLDATALRAGML